MNTYIIICLALIPMYLISNYICYKRKNISYWIMQDMLGGNSLKVIDSSYYDFQYKSCIKSCILLCIITILGIFFSWGDIFLVVFLVLFHSTVSATKHFAFKKNYLLKNRES